MGCNKIVNIHAITNPGTYYAVKEFYANDNEIVTISVNAFDLFDQLRILELRNNKIAVFPFTNIFDTAKLSSLEILDLKCNDLTSVADSSASFPRSLQMQMDLRGIAIYLAKIFLTKFYLTKKRKSYETAWLSVINMSC